MVSLAPPCLRRGRGIVLHELMHVLGFWHEHARADRDRYIRVNWHEILPGKIGIQAGWGAPCSLSNSSCNDTRCSAQWGVRAESACQSGTLSRNKSLAGNRQGVQDSSAGLECERQALRGTWNRGSLAG